MPAQGASVRAAKPLPFSVMNAGPTTVNGALRAALALQQGGDLPAAEQAYRALLARFGSQPDAEHMLGVTLHALGRSADALPWFERAEQARTGVMLWNNHAAALLALGRGREAAMLARRAVESEAENAGAWLNLGLALEIDRDFDGAIAALHRTLSLKPANDVADRALSRCRFAWAQRRIALGDTDTGLDGLRRWLADHPHDDAVAGTYLFSCNYSEAMTPPAMLSEHRRFPLACEPRQSRPRPVSQRLRIGWVKDVFGADLSAIFLGDVMEALPLVAPDIEHVLYAVGGNPRAAPKQTGWAAAQQDVSHLDDQRLIERLERDRIDILIDLMGRTTGNRACLFAARAAPVQIAWLDAFYTTGIGAMDYLITDPWLSPPDADKDFTEKLIRLPHGRLAYNPPPAPAPAVDEGHHRRFVSLNRFSKINAQVIAVWAAILHKLPSWTLLLKARGRDDDLAAHFRSNFARAGIDPDRVEIEGESTYAEAMATYGRASVALDPFPFSGCSTTCDALWMGVPVVTWPRATMASRQTAAWLTMAGKSEWIADDAQSYIDIAVNLANDEATRGDWRRNARDILRPTICAAERLARELVDALRAAAGR
jgi:protein O-GlcNAc transferase